MDQGSQSILLRGRQAFRLVDQGEGHLDVFDALAAAVKAGKLGRDGREIDAIRVTVGESPTARAWYEGALW